MNDRLERVGTEINPAVLENETLAFLFKYWNDKRGTRAMPTRAEIKASEIKEHLGWVILMEVLPGFSDFRYKLIGTLVNQYYLGDSTGKTVREAFFAERGKPCSANVRATKLSCDLLAMPDGSARASRNSTVSACRFPTTAKRST
jgi:hypothetical protein